MLDFNYSKKSFYLNERRLKKLLLSLYMLKIIIFYVEVAMFLLKQKFGSFWVPSIRSYVR